MLNHAFLLNFLNVLHCCYQHTLYRDYALLVNFRRKLRLQLLDLGPLPRNLAVEALDGLLVLGFLLLALADRAHQLFDLVRRVACGPLPAVAERRHLHKTGVGKIELQFACK